MFRSATFQLTMWYLAIAMAISLLFSVVLFNITTNELNNGIRRESSRIMTEFPVFQDDPRFHHTVDYDASVRHILFQLIILNASVFVLAGISSYLLARRTLAPIEAAHEQQKRFTADVSHELRTPLTALRMESEVALLNDKLPANELRSTLQSNLEEVAKLETLINNLLRLTRLEADLLQQSFTGVNISHIARDAVEQLQPLAARRKVTLKLEQGAKHVLALGDTDSLTQAVVILVDNAIKYSAPGDTVVIRTLQNDKQSILQVIDNGPGISKQELTHVFDRFYRAEKSRNKQDGEGFGLGLSIAKMIADIHDAAITLTSKPGHGTTASIVMAAAPSEGQNTPQ
jgi:two-component system, OmpR family, sensor histidine kinase CiaH